MPSYQQVSCDVSSTLLAIAGHVMLHASLLGHLSIFLSELVGQAHREMEELKQVLTASHVQAAN